MRKDKGRLMMKKAVLFGAGQVGAMVSNLIGSSYRVICFADNCEDKWGEKLFGIPVVSPAESISFKPDLVCLCVTGNERIAEMKDQLKKLGFDGEIISAETFKLFDSRAATLRLLAEQINANNTEGDCAELGVFRGDFAALINGAFPGRRLHLFDTFEGFREIDVESEKGLGFSKAKAGDFSDTSEESVREKLPYPEKAVFHRGWFPETFRGLEGLSFSFVSIDADLYAPTAAALPVFWERLSPGGAIMVHDYNSLQYKGVKKAVDDFCAEIKRLPFPVPDLHGSCVIRK